MRRSLHRREGHGGFLERHAERGGGADRRERRAHQMAAGKREPDVGARVSVVGDEAESLEPARRDIGGPKRRVR